MDKNDMPSDSDLSDEDYCPENEKIKLSEDSSGCGSVNSEDESEAIQTNSSKNKGNKHMKNSRTKKTVKRLKKTKGLESGKNDKNKDSDDSEDENIKAKAEKTIDEFQKIETRGSLAANNKSEHKSIEKDLLDSDEEEKKRTESLWASFLADDKPATESTEQQDVHLSAPSQTLNLSNGKNVLKETTEKSGKVIEVLEFAGEEIKVEKKIVPKSLLEKKVSEKPKPLLSTGFGRAQKRPSGSGGGLSAVLGQIGKNTKLSVLEKSKLDWNSFKHDQGISEELETFNKGKDGYLERQDFLQRTDLRQFEIERNIRQANRNKQ